MKRKVKVKKIDLLFHSHHSVRKNWLDKILWQTFRDDDTFQTIRVFNTMSLRKQKKLNL